MLKLIGKTYYFLYNFFVGEVTRASNDFYDIKRRGEVLTPDNKKQWK